MEHPFALRNLWNMLACCAICSPGPVDILYTCAGCAGLLCLLFRKLTSVEDKNENSLNIACPGTQQLSGCQNMDSNGLMTSGAEAFQAYSLSDAQVKS
jgi:putative metalloprotease